MTESVATIIVQVVLSTLAGLIAAVVTARLSQRSFQKEKWWEAKMEAYTRIIDAVHHIKRDHGIDIDAMRTDRVIPESEKQELLLKYKASMAEIERNLDIGEFLFSDRAMDELRKLLKGLDQAGQETRMWQDYLEESFSAASTCLTKIKRIARADLGLGESSGK